MSWMGSEGPAGRGAPVFRVVFWRLGGIGRSRGDRARLADRHFTSCREGGGSRGNGLLQGKKTRPGERGGVGGKARRRSRAASASREAEVADAAGPSQVTLRPRAWPRGGARGGGARARASAYKRAAPPFPPERARRRAPASAAVLQCLHPAA